MISLELTRPKSGAPLVGLAELARASIPARMIAERIFSMAFWRLYYHLVWATRGRKPTITRDREAKLYPFLLHKAQELECTVYAIGGIEDHIHLIISIPPKLAISDCIRQLKGSSTHFINNNIALPEGSKFAWQKEYAIFSLSQKGLEPATAYVRNQKTHHANATTIPALERTADSPTPEP